MTQPKVPTTEHVRTDDTLFKVYDALRNDLALTEKIARAAIDAIRNKGIVFFEKVESTVQKDLGTVYRGVQDADVAVPPVDSDQAASQPTE